MKTIGTIFLLCLSFGATGAFAQSLEGSVSAGVSQISDSAGDLGSGFNLDNGFKLAFRLNINPYEHIGFEGGYAYNRTHLNYEGVSQGGFAVHQGTGDVLAFATKVGSRIRPYVAGGIGFSNFVPPGQTAQYGQGETKFALNYGAGARFKVKGPFFARVDVRQFNSGKPFSLGGSGRLLQNEFTVGVGYAFGQ